MVKGIDIAAVVCIIIITLIYLTQAFWQIAGVFVKPKLFPETKNYHKFGVLICAHDEEDVINGLITSIEQNHYPQDKLKIFVICDNCKDKTYERASMHPECVIIVRNDENLIGKSYALDYAFKQILANEEYNDIEAFMIFDADNLLKKNYIHEMNKCFDSGVEIATSFRNGKNFNEGYISAASELFFLREAILVHKARNHFNVGTFVSGTGFYIARHIIEELNGWPFHTLTEDIEFSLYEAMLERKVGYCDAAEFYDEQPVTFKSFVRQRLRWCKGTLQVFQKYIFKAIKAFFTKKDKLTIYELTVHVTPVSTIAFFIFVILEGLYCLAFAFGDLTNWMLAEKLLSTFYSFILSYTIIALFTALLTIMIVDKRVNSKLGTKLMAILLFPLYTLLYIPLSIIAMFTKVQWKKIPHHDISAEEKKMLKRLNDKNKK